MPFQHAPSFRSGAGLLIVVTLFSIPLLAGEPGRPELSSFEAKLHFLGDLPRGPQDITIPAENALAGDRKSTGLAIVFSLLLPGMGELYGGDFSSGKYFLIAEGALWITFGIFDMRGGSLQQDARTFAVARAGVNPNGKDDQFYVDIGNFNSVDDYNQKKLQDREPQKMYDPAAGYGWLWSSEADRAEFRNQRVASDQSYENGKFVLAAIVVNHVASAINAARVAVAHNKTLEAALKDVELRASVIGGVARPEGILLSLSKGF